MSNHLEFYGKTLNFEFIGIALVISLISYIFVYKRWNVNCNTFCKQSKSTTKQNDLKTDHFQSEA